MTLCEITGIQRLPRKPKKTLKTPPEINEACLALARGDAAGAPSIKPPRKPPPPLVALYPPCWPARPLGDYCPAAWRTPGNGIIALLTDGPGHPPGVRRTPPPAAPHPWGEGVFFGFNKKKKFSLLGEKGPPRGGKKVVC